MMPAPPVQIQSCTVMRQNTTPLVIGTRIAFVNTGTVPLHRVTFRLGYHLPDNPDDDVAMVTDTGTFAPGVRIEHRLDAFEGDTWTGIWPTSCVATDAS